MRKNLPGQGREPRLGAGDLGAGDLALRPVGLRGPGPHGVETDDPDLVVEEGRLGLGVDEVPVAAERVEEAREQLEMGDVVVARHRHPGRREPGQEGAGLGIFPAPRAHGEVARGDDQVGRGAVQLVHEPLDHGRVGAPEMQVGDMRDPPHGRFSSGVMVGTVSVISAGTITVSARGRSR